MNPTQGKSGAPVPTRIIPHGRTSVAEGHESDVTLPAVGHAAAGPCAQADGLSADEAYALMVWLQETDHAGIEMVPTEGSSYSVRWRR